MSKCFSCRTQIEETGQDASYEWNGEAVCGSCYIEYADNRITELEEIETDLNNTIGFMERGISDWKEKAVTLEAKLAKMHKACLIQDKLRMKYRNEVEVLEADILKFNDICVAHTRKLAGENEMLKAVIDGFWEALHNSYNVEARDVIEADTKDSWTKGTSPLAVALHYVWKREPKVTELQWRSVEDTVANLLCYLVDCYENQPLSEMKLQEIGTQFLKDKHYNKPITLPEPKKESK